MAGAMDDSKRHLGSERDRYGSDDALTRTVPRPSEGSSRKPAAKRKGKERTVTAASAATLEDELLGLVEADDVKVGASGGGANSHAGASSPPVGYSDEDDEEEERGNLEDSLQAERFDPDVIVQPSGLTRHEIISKVTRGDMSGLTETDVKAVQDEMWLREKAGSAPTNKDGTVRRKPGPAKGWKKLRGKDWDDGRSDGGTSVGDGAGSTVNGEAEADIAALLGEEESDAPTPVAVPAPAPAHVIAPGRTASGRKSRAKKRKVEELVSEPRPPAEGSELDSEDERILLGEPGAAPGSRGGRIKEPGVGKGRWTRPIRPADARGDEFDPDQSAMYDSLPIETIQVVPNSYDPRGVSEAEARVRLSIVEDLERTIWASICRDIPRVSTSSGTLPDVVISTC